MSPSIAMLHWTILDSHYLLRRPWMHVREDHIRLPGGQDVEEFHVIEYPEWTCVVCLTEDERMVMVEQYRHGVRRTTLELPAGAVDAGEEPLMAARRELLEETGYVADAWTLLGRCAPNPSKQTNYAHLYVARGARKVRAQRLDLSEVIDVHLLDVAEVLRRADAGDLMHGIHVAALFWAERRGLLPTTA